MANKGEIDLTLVVNDDGTVTVKRFTEKAEDNIKSLSKAITNKLGSAFKKVGSLSKTALGFVANQLFSLKGAIAGLGLGMLVKDTINVGAAFEKMKLSLDTITKGEGEKWFNDLNQWALKMPVNTEKAIQSFTQMRAMGLKPTIDQMTTLVDTMSALGGEGDMLEGIARALGQIQTKGKVSAEELMQLAERGIPVFEILKQKFGDVETSTLDAGLAIAAIFDGLEDRFGGQSVKMQSTWAGMMESLYSYWKEFQRLVMEGGVMEYLKDALSIILEWVDKLYKEGKLQAWAEIVATKIIEAFDWIIDTSAKVYEYLKDNWDGIVAVFNAVLWIVEQVAKAFDVLGKYIGTVMAQIVTAYEKFTHLDIFGGLAELANAAGPGTFNQIVIDTYAGGTPYVPRTGLYQLHEGERVLTREENRYYNNSSNITVNVPQGSRAADDPAELARYITRQQQRLKARGLA